MRKKSILFLIIALFSICAFANDYDSLLHVVKNNTGIKKLEALSSLAFKYKKTNKDSAFLLINQALTIAKDNENAKNIASTLIVKGRIYNHYNQYSKAIKILKKSISIAKKNQLGKQLLYAKYRLFRVYRFANQYDNAIALLNEIERLAKVYNELQILADTYNTVGLCYYYKGYYDKTIQYFKQSLKAYAKLNMSKNVAGLSMNIGVIAYKNGKINESLVYYKKALKYFSNENDAVNTAMCYENIAITLEKTNMDSALIYQKNAIEIYDSLNKKMSLSRCYMNISFVYNNLGEHSKALGCLIQALKINVVEGNKFNIANIYVQLSSIYEILKQYNKVKKYLYSALYIYKTMKREQKTSSTYLSLANLYNNLGKHKTALYFIHKSIKIKEKIGDDAGMAYAKSSLGNTYKLLGDKTKALKCFEEALNMITDKGDLSFKAGLYLNLGVIYFDKKDYLKAKKYYEKSLDLRLEINDIVGINESYQSLAKINYELKKFRSAYDYLLLYVSGKEKALNEDITRQISEMNAKYQSERKENEITLLKKDKQTQKMQYIESQKRANIMLGSAFIFVLFCILIALILFRNNKRKQKANLELESKNREITDSITYAKRIQKAILPSSKVAKELLQNSFVYYKPKDIVAGDFYWLERKGNKILFAAADCTGHGVPGAMVSVICNNGLNRSVREYNLSVPGKILDKTREIVIKEFEKSDEDVKDGMDITLCSLENLKLQYAGANNPLWIVKKDSNEIEEIKPDKQPIGKSHNTVPFKTHNLTLEKGDSIYLFTDGFADQFGGENGKKFKAANFKKLILSIQNESMEKQKELISQAFESWKGPLEQVDDVCVIGVRL